MTPGTIADLTPDPSNANAGTERGTYMLTESMQRLGAGRSVLTDRHGTLIAGNKSHATAGAIGIEDTIVVRTKGDRLVVVWRDDLDLSAPTHTDEYQKARELSVADNQSAIAGIKYDGAVIAEYIGEGVELDAWFLPAELETILTTDIKAMDADEDEQGDRPKRELNCTCPSCGHEFIREMG